MAYELQKARELVIRAGLELSESGLIARTWGNISARISDTQFVITPSGRAYEDLTPDQIVITNIEDCSYEGSVKPSSEKWIHADAYKLRPEVNFVIHTHQNYASALSILGDTVLEVPKSSSFEALLGPVVPTAGYGPNGSQELSRNVIEAISGSPSSSALLMANHGAECLGTDYDNAFAIAHALEDLSRARYRSLIRMSLAYGLILPTDEEIAEEDSLGSDLSRYYEISEGGYGGAPFTALSRAPFTMSASKIAVPMLYPYLDDQAQIAGTDLPILEESADKDEIQEALRDRNAVLIRGKGAVCTGASAEDVEAAAMVLEKGCRAAMLARVQGNVPPLSAEHAKADRIAYITSYSKLKDER